MTHPSPFALVLLTFSLAGCAESGDDIPPALAALHQQAAAGDVVPLELHPLARAAGGSNDCPLLLRCRSSRPGGYRNEGHNEPFSISGGSC